VKSGPGINSCGQPWRPNDDLCSCVDVPPNSDTCGGRYSLSNPLHQNFGDPLCTFSSSRLAAQLKILDPQYLQCWMEIAACESTLNPNSWGTGLGGLGVWGLFQMDCHLLGGCSPNNQWDVGDVVWCKQAQNAVDYSHFLAGRDLNRFSYWGCYKNHPERTPSCPR
jgi:hypothetical protein